MVDKARENITPADAEQLILARWKQTLRGAYENRVAAYQSRLVSRVELLWSKYAVTLNEIQAKRKAAADNVGAFLRERGYE